MYKRQDSAVAVLEYADALMPDQPEQSIKILEAFTQKHPENLDVQLGLAKAYALTQNKKGIQKQLSILDSYSKKSAALSYSLATITDAISLDSDTKRFLMQFERLAIEHSVMIDRLPQAYFSLGLLDFRQKHYEAASSWFSKVSSKSEFFPRARVLQARALERTGKIKEALSILEHTKVDSTLQTDIWIEQSYIYYRNQQLEKAYKTLLKVLEATPDNPDVIAQVAFLASELNYDNEAEQLLRDGIEKYPDRADFYNSLGYMLLTQQNQIKEAGQLLKKAIELNPNSIAIQDSIGWYYFKVKNYDLARKYLEKAAKNLQDAEILMHLAELYHTIEDQKKFSDVIEKLRQIKDKDTTSINVFFKRFNITP